MKKNQKGFAAPLIIAAIVVIAIIVAGVFVYRHDHSKTNINSASINSSAYSSNSAKENTQPAKPYNGWKTYTSADKVYTINYPSNWLAAPCASTDNCHTDSFSFDDGFYPPTTSGYVVYVQHTNSNLTPKAWLDQYEVIPSSGKCLYGENSDAINNYPAYFVEVAQPLLSCPSSAPQGSYSDGASGGGGYMDYYVVTNKNQVVMFSMSVQNGSSGTRNTVPLVPTFKEMVSSLKFNN